MIELQGLTKRYGDKTAVDHLTFTVRPGVVTGFLGPNGAGKSTTMRILLGLDSPSSGEVRIDGKLIGQVEGRRGRYLSDREMAASLDSRASLESSKGMPRRSVVRVR